MQKPAGAWITQYVPGSLVEADVVGAGCLLIHRSVLEKMAYEHPNPVHPNHPWFDWRVDVPPTKLPDGTMVFPDGVPSMSEDFVFNLRARQLGFKTFVDSSVVCRHVGNAQALPGVLEPCEATPNT